MRRRGPRWLLLLTCLPVLGGCAGGDPLSLPARSPTESPAPAGSSDEVGDGEPRGTLRIAYPDVPATWTGLDGRDTAATDLAALWALPLLRYDADGQLLPGLGTEFSFPEVDEGWAVEVSLAEGEWSDGSPVLAADVVSTVEALRQVRADEWSSLVGVAATGPRHVRFTFEEPYGRWAHLLTAPPGILPATILGQEGLPAYATDVPISGGSYLLESFEPGRSAAFVAHADGPLGPPRVARVEILFVPAYETALGLLDRDEVDVVLGHLALNPVGRAEELDGVQAAAPLGGTVVSLEWEPDAALGASAEERRDAAAAIDLTLLVAGLLRGVGEPATSLIAEVEGPVDVAVGRPSAGGLEIQEEIVLLVPRWHEALGFTARALQRDLVAAGADVRVVSVESPEHLDPIDPYDGSLRIRRDPPRPALGGEGDLVPPGPVVVLEDELEETFARLADEATVTPLYRIGVAHAWRDVAGLEPSSWPGLALTGIAHWQIDDAR